MTAGSFVLSQTSTAGCGKRSSQSSVSSCLLLCLVCSKLVFWSGLPVRASGPGHWAWLAGLRLLPAESHQGSPMPRTRRCIGQSCRSAGVGCGGKGRHRLRRCLLINSLASFLRKAIRDRRCLAHGDVSGSHVSGSHVSESHCQGIVGRGGHWLQ